MPGYKRALRQNIIISSLPFLLQFIIYYIQIDRYIETLQSAFVMRNLKFAIRLSKNSHDFITAEGNNSRIVGSFVFSLARRIFRLRSNLLLATLEARDSFPRLFPSGRTVIAGITFCPPPYPPPACLTGFFTDSHRVRKRIDFRWRKSLIKPIYRYVNLFNKTLFYRSLYISHVDIFQIISSDGNVTDPTK